MNRFLRGNRIVAVEKQLINVGNITYWSFCIQYVITQTTDMIQGERKEKIDYKNVLEAPVFEVFSKLRVYANKLLKTTLSPHLPFLQTQNLLP